jgi:hypothetical protein
MNSEELELSLKAEFDSYLSGVFAEMKHEVAEFQTKIDAEFEKHKSQLDDAIKTFSAKFEAERSVDKGFSESVVEHLRLARDDGAQLAATAFAEAEDMQRSSAASSSQGFDTLRNAINDISSKTSQSSILKALTDHCSQYAPRGAFFIIRNEHFVGWRVIGSETDAVGDIKFSISSNTLLHEAVNSLSAVESKYGAHSDDKDFLKPLSFGKPGNMFAVPLVARGRGVAVLYVDGGAENAAFNKEALETLVRVASLTVELLAASQATKTGGVDEPAQPKEAEPEAVTEASTAYEPAAAESAEPESVAVEAETEEEIYPVEAVMVEDEPEAAFESVKAEFESSEAPEFDGAVTQIQVEPEPTDFAFASPEPVPEEHIEEVKAEEQTPFESNSAGHANGNGHMNGKEAVVETAAAEPAKSPTRSWKVDLPIEVGDDERGLHNDAGVLPGFWFPRSSSITKSRSKRAAKPTTSTTVCATPLTARAKCTKNA